jgi:hypothetical protein
MSTPSPRTDREAAIQNAASVIASFCGRSGDGPMASCHHDHTADGQALVRSVEQYAFPELLRGLQSKAARDDSDLDLLIDETIEELEARALVVVPR